MKRLPLFDENFSTNFLRPVIQELAKRIFEQVEHLSQPGWLTGLAGVAVFSAEYSAWRTQIPFIRQEKNTAFNRLSDSHISKLPMSPMQTKPPMPPPFAATEAILERIIRQINDGFTFPTFAAGLSGIYWALNYLGQRHFISDEEGGILDPVADYLLRWATDQHKKGNTDILHGALGPVYALSAHETPVINAQETVDFCTGLLHDPRQADLGMAHGISGQAIVINQARKRITAGEKEDRAIREKIEEAMVFLLDQADWSMSRRSVFPTKMLDGNAVFPSRMAWCYGDVGIGMALLSLENDYDILQGLGEKVLALASIRQEPENTRVADPFLCHGSAGLSLMFYKAWRETKNNKLKEAAKFWTQRTLDYLRNLTPGEPVDNVSLLDGLTGITLTLMAIDQGTLPGWETGIFLSTY